MRVAIYARVSSEDQHVDQQVAALAWRCKEAGYEYRSFRDEAVSGLVSDRPAWNELLRRCERGEFDAIMVFKLDRITRDMRYALDFLAWFDARPPAFQVLSAFEALDLRSPDGRFTFKLRCLMSEYELEQLRYRSRLGIERAKREGKYKYGKGRPKPKESRP